MNNIVINQLYLCLLGVLYEDHVSSSDISIKNSEENIYRKDLQKKRGQQIKQKENTLKGGKKHNAIKNMQNIQKNDKKKNKGKFFTYLY